MKLKLKVTLILLISLIIKKSAGAQQTFYDLGTIQTIEIFFSQPNWDYQMDTAKYGAEDFILADIVIVNGISYDSVGVKYKGNSSYDSTYIKNPMHIELDAFKKQSYEGFKDIKLSNGYSDPSLIREPLAYSILSNYMDCPKANFAKLFINGNYIGIYSNAESINKDFCSNHFYSSKNTLLKCNPIVNPGPTTKSNLRYITGADSSGYNNFYEVKSDYGWNDLVALCDSVTNNPASTANVLDVDRILWMLAFNNTLVNLDSYTGVFAQNYYLYKDHTGHFNPVIWDLNMCFGGFPFAGAGATGLAGLSITNMQEMPLDLHSTDPFWPVINNVFNDPTYKRMYIAHMRTIMSEFIYSGSYETLSAQLQSLITTDAIADTNKFYTDSDFQNGMTTDVSVGSYSVPGIKNLMDARANYLSNTIEFSLMPPSITNVLADNTTPVLNTTVTITADVAGAMPGGVYLGYRILNSDKFTRISMYDDGLHNDGTAGDNNFGASVTISSALTQYYIYAENNDAGIFSPQRAEHEFYSILTDLPTAQAGEITINELLPLNQADTIDENGKYEDWIEFYNTTSSPLSMFGLYLTDDLSNPTKFSFPENSFIPANGYLIVFADEDATTTQFIHCNFKLSANGETIMLSNQSGDVLDSITFGVPVIDVAFGRCPNGTGPFQDLVSSTFNSENCPVSVDELSLKETNLSIFPNPASDKLNLKITINASEEMIFTVKDLHGKIMYVGKIKDVAQLNTSEWSAGIYFVMCGNSVEKLVVGK